MLKANLLGTSYFLVPQLHFSLHGLAKANQMRNRPYSKANAV